MEIMLNLDTPEHHPTSKMPKAIRELWYFSGKEKLLSLIKSYGCPHTGGQHRFHFTAKVDDVIAWLDLFEETFPDCSPEVTILKSKINLGITRGIGTNLDGNMRLELKAIQRQVEYNGETLTRPWFWSPQWEEE